MAEVIHLVPTSKAPADKVSQCQQVEARLATISKDAERLRIATCADSGGGVRMGLRVAGRRSEREK